MKNESKVPFLFKRISAPSESDRYELAAGRLMIIMSLFEFNESEIVLNRRQYNINDHFISINSEVEVVVSDLYQQTFEPLEKFVLMSAIIGVIEACIHVNTPVNLNTGISNQLAKLLRSYKSCNL
jgi:hypothetical protein